MQGLARAPASAASLLLHLEGVFTALIAWLVFRENLDRRIAIGMAAIAAGGVVLSWQGRFVWGGKSGPPLEHVHDAHHRHAHAPDDPPVTDPVPHSHRHAHEPLTRSHPHYPGLHHRHDHD